MVDDDEAVLRACARGLGRDTRLFKARSADQARHIARTEQLDLIVVDYRLGAENGIELVRELKAEQPERRVVLISGVLLTDIAVDAMRAGADDARHKPVGPRALLRWLDTGSWDEPGRAPVTPSMDRVHWEHTRRAMGDASGNVSEAARRLGVQRSTVRRALRQPRPRR